MIQWNIVTPKQNQLWLSFGTFCWPTLKKFPVNVPTSRRCLIEFLAIPDIIAKWNIFLIEKCDLHKQNVLSEMHHLKIGHQNTVSWKPEAKEKTHYLLSYVHGKKFPLLLFVGGGVALHPMNHPFLGQ